MASYPWHSWEELQKDEIAVILINFHIAWPQKTLYRKVMEYFTGILALSFAMFMGCYVAGMLPLSITLSEVGLFIKHSVCFEAICVDFIINIQL